MTADDKYSLLNRDNLTQPIPTQLSQKQKAFFQFFVAFSKSTLNFEHLQKKMTFIVEIFPILRTPKNVVRYMSKKSRFKGPFYRQHGKRFQHCCDLIHSTVTIFTDHFEGNWVGKSLF